MGWQLNHWLAYLQSGPHLWGFTRDNHSLHVHVYANPFTFLPGRKYFKSLAMGIGVNQNNNLNKCAIYKRQQLSNKKVVVCIASFCFLVPSATGSMLWKR
eukprot:6349265-Amphidinium_carterae.1